MTTKMRKGDNDGVIAELASQVDRHDKAARIEFICELMREMMFERGRTWKVLAKTWGLSSTTIRQETAEASRRIGTEMTDPDAAKADVGTVLNAALRRAHNDDDRRWIVETSKVILALTGIKAADKHEFTMREGDPTPYDAAKAVREAFGGKDVGPRPEASEQADQSKASPDDSDESDSGSESGHSE